MDINAAVAAGAENPLLLFAMALVLGALHGLEPGHSKTMMAAYIIAIRGTAFQALLLGLPAASRMSVCIVPDSPPLSAALLAGMKFPDTPAWPPTCAVPA